ncbi:MAG: AhpC/TSA family protein [Telmatospirillum sp.]|nr:AhpC/TSA family protein [Telmatospirillum sp.]
MENLATQLDGFRTAWIDRVGSAIAGTIAADIETLRGSGIVAKARTEGAAFPQLALPDQLGRPVDLGMLADERPLVIVFYRGGWCPYCNLELRAYQQKLAEIHAAGARLVAVTPETPDNALSTVEKNDLDFDVLSDVQGALADALGIRFRLSPEIEALYRKFGHDLPTHNGDGEWSLPIPATYVVERGGRIAYVHVDPDYRKRAEPAAVLAALAHLAQPAL